MSEDYYLGCMTCKEKIWVGGNMEIYGAIDSNLHKIIEQYIMTLEFIENVWITRFVIIEPLKQFFEKHKNTENHYLRILGDSDDIYHKTMRNFKEIKC